jgi:carbonic anhydrase/acetyltransferase-like protein (isoleucine patch superfamily)
MPIYALGDAVPAIDRAAWVHPDAVVIGSVTIGAEASVWPCAVLRGDFGRIEVGARSSVQDGTVLHTTPDSPTIVGRECVIGHNVYLEGCTIEDECLVGSMSSVLPGAVLRRGAVVAAGAVVTRGTEVPEHALALGVPAEIRAGAVEEGRWADGVQRYVDMARRYELELREVT